MENFNAHNEDGFEKELHELEEEISLEKERLKIEQQELKIDEKRIDHLEQEVKELKEHRPPGHPATAVELIFVVNGTPVKILAKFEWPLQKAAEEAMQQSGNANRPISDWTIKRGSQTLSMSSAVGSFNFKDCETLLMSLNAGQGGSRTGKEALCKR